MHNIFHNPIVYLVVFAVILSATMWCEARWARWSGRGKDG